MRLRTFTAPDIPSAMDMVREELGENAIILATDAKAGNKNITVTAAVEETDEEELDDFSFQPMDYDKSDVASVSESGNAMGVSNDVRSQIDDIVFEFAFHLA